MKLAVMLVLCGGWLTLNLHANPCVAGSLSSYISLGTTGCTIGTNVVSSFVDYSSGTTGATELPASAVSIAPSGGDTDPQLQFTVNESVDAPPLLETLFTYQISGNPYNQSQIDLSGSSETGQGAVTDVQNLCADGTFGPDGVDGCTGTPNSLLTLDGFINTNSTPLSVLSFLTVTDDFTIDPSDAGSASGGVFTDQFTVSTTTVPEPALSVLPCALLFALAALRKRR